MRPCTSSTSYKMGDRYSSPATPHAKRRCSSKSAATLPAGAAGDGEVRDATTPSNTTTCIADTKEWTVAAEIPKDASTSDGSSSVG